MNITGSNEPEKRTLTCKFSCADCGAEKVEFEVPVRPVALDVVTWMKDIVTPRAAAAHSKYNSQCKARVLKNVMIPIGDEHGNESPHIGALPTRAQSATDTETRLIRFRNTREEKQAAPTSLDEYNARVKVNTKIVGAGANTRTILPCPFCAAANWLTYPVTAALDDYKKLAEPSTCSACSRTASIITTRTANGVSQELVQVAGDDPPDWLIPKPRRIS